MKDDGGCAFPTIEHVCDPRSAGFAGYMGMTLRDYFAAKAMHSLLVTHANSSGWSKDTVASQAYKMADAMIEERNKP